MRKLLGLLTVGIMLLATSSVAGAFQISYNDLTPGQTYVSNALDGWFAQAYESYDMSGQSVNGTFGWKTVGDVTAAGVTGGAPGNEIDSDEAIFVGFNSAQIVSEISLAFLYPDGEFGDKGNEIAVIVPYLANQNGDIQMLAPVYLQFTLEATGFTSAVWSGSGLYGSTVVNLAEAQDNPQSGALWQINNPFGNMQIDGLLFLTQDPYTGASDGDYSLYSISTSQVPVPAAVWLLGSGLVGLVGLRRKFNI